MGCDIHEYMEIKISGKWFFIASPWVERNYALFGTLAGVRCDGPALFQDRGLPKDVTELVQNDYDMGEPDWHNPAYFTYDELPRLRREYTKFLDGERNFPGALKEMEKLAKLPSVEDVRFVFWFDN